MNLLFLKSSIRNNLSLFKVYSLSMKFSSVFCINQLNVNKINFDNLSNQISHNLVKNISTDKVTINKSFNFLYKFTSFNMRTMRKKLKQRTERTKKYTCQKNRSSLRRRVVIVGPSFNRHFVFRRVGFHHKRTKKGARNKSKPTYKLVALCNRRYYKRNLPGFKSRKIKKARMIC